MADAGDMKRSQQASNSSDSTTTRADKKNKKESTSRAEEIYVLECDGNRYYCGETSDFAARLAEHLGGLVPWTQKFVPTGIVERRPKQHAFDELVTTLTYMAEHGMDNVRGETYVSVTLS